MTSTGAPDRPAEEEARGDYSKRKWDCMRDQGIRVDDSGENVRIFGSDDAIANAEAECEKQLGAEPTWAPLTEEEITTIYNQSVAAKQCLEAKGFEVSQPPSLQEFIEVYRQWQTDYNANPWPWWPFETITDPAATGCPEPTLLK